MVYGFNLYPSFVQNTPHYMREAQQRSLVFFCFLCPFFRASESNVRVSRDMWGVALADRFCCLYVVVILFFELDMQLHGCFQR